MAQSVNRPEHKAAPVVLSIAGFDPSSGAGVTADIKTIAAHGCYGATCITALTVQNTRGVRAVEVVRPEVVRASLRELAADLPISAIRIGMLGSAAVAEVVAEFLESTRLPITVLDPIVRASSGAELLEPAGVAILRQRMLPLVSVVTPNVEEVAVLAGTPVNGPASAAVGLLGADAEPRLQAAVRAAEVLLNQGVQAIVVTGGHLEKPNDVLLWRWEGILQLRSFPSRRIESRSTHGTGCAFASALACRLALGAPLPEAVAGAQQYVLRAIETAERIGQGTGPINHLWPLVQRPQRGEPGDSF